MEDSYVAWLKYKTHPNGATTVHLCDSCDDGAFKVYRTTPSVPPAPKGEDLGVQELPPKPYLTEDGNGNKTHYPADMTDAYISALSSRCESLQRDLELQREATKAALANLAETPRLIFEACESLRAELARERELVRDLREALKRAQRYMQNCGVNMERDYPEIQAALPEPKSESAPKPDIKESHE